MPQDDKFAAVMAAKKASDAEERVRCLLRSCCCKVRACERDVSTYGGALGFGDCTYGTAIFPHPDDSHFIVSSELTCCAEDSTQHNGGYCKACAYTDTRIECNINGEWISGKIIWQGQNVTLCKIENFWFSKPHPAIDWCSHSCFACVLDQHDRCQIQAYPYRAKHYRQGLKLANAQEDNGRNVVVVGWWGEGAKTTPFVAQPATISVDAQGLTLSACITHARYSCGAAVLDSITGEFVGIVKGDIKNDNIPKDGRQEIVSAQEMHKIPWEVAGKHIGLLCSGESCANMKSRTGRGYRAAPVKPVAQDPTE